MWALLLFRCFQHDYMEQSGLVAHVGKCVGSAQVGYVEILDEIVLRRYILADYIAVPEVNGLDSTLRENGSRDNGYKKNTAPQN